MESILGILVCDVKVGAGVGWLGGRRSRRQSKGEKERKRKERRRGEKRQRAVCRGPTQLAGTEASPSGFPRQSPPPVAAPSFGPQVGRAGSGPGSLALSERPCLRPRRRWHGDSGQVCKLVPLSPGQGEPWRPANMTQENVC